MDQEAWRRIESLFEQALALEAGQRAQFLDRSCGGDSELRTEIESMLLFQEEGRSLAVESKLLSDVESRHPERIGPYRIEREIAAGGMGVVYEAEQESPVRRRVALKLVKWGMDTKEVIARFESERQALALMNHPNVAQVFDAGATETGRPYFAMEYVDGDPITSYCDAHRLGLRQRLELFIEVCKGVQHAHHKGIIHRDIKPGNVLVALREEEPVPRIIDFGIAKAISHRLTERTAHTELGRLIGTPEYMSPEQAEMSVQDVDTRTDVYSLGVLLYELLVGTQPLDSTELRESDFDEMRRKIREEDPPRPSARLTSLGASSRTVAENRRLEPRALSRALRGDLDWIVMKALEKDRDRRYSSPSDLAEDLGRYLRDEPVVARPPNASYRIGKFVRRHRSGVAWGVVVAVLAVAFVVAMAWQAVRVGSERDRANLEAATAREVSDFLVELFEVSDPSESRGNRVTAREILDQGAVRLAQELKDRPLMRARLMRTIGSVYWKLGLYAEARPLLEDALALSREGLGTENEVADSLEQLALLQEAEGDYDGARAGFGQALTIREKLQGSDTPEVAQVLFHLGRVAWKRNDWARAHILYQRALDIRQRVLGPESMAVAASLRNLGILTANEGKPETALQLYERSLRIYEKNLGDDHPDMADLLESMALVHEDMDEPDRALALMDRALAIREKVFAPDHPTLAFSLHNKGRLLANTGDLEGAKRLYQRAREIREQALGPDHPLVGNVLESEAILLARTGDLNGARKGFERALAINEAARGPRHWETVETLQNLAILAMMEGRRDDALRRLREAVDRGFRDLAALEAFEDLYGDPAFEALRVRVRQAQ